MTHANHTLDGPVKLRGQFLEAMSRTAATVNVITTDGLAGRAGMTVSAMSSVSADTPKPSLLICLNRSSSAGATILANGAFCVNVLKDGQSEVSDAFAGRHGPDSERFDCGTWINGVTGAPILANALVAFDCLVSHTELVGSHHVVFGEVQEVIAASDGGPLLYSGRTYGRLAQSPQSKRSPVKNAA